MLVAESCLHQCKAGYAGGPACALSSWIFVVDNRVQSRYLLRLRPSLIALVQKRHFEKPWTADRPWQPQIRPSHVNNRTPGAQYRSAVKLDMAALDMALEIVPADS